MSIIRSMRSLSYIENIRKKSRITSIIMGAVIKKFLKGKYDFIICGHTHRMVQNTLRFSNKTKIFFILSKWEEYCSNYLEIREDMELPVIKSFVG